MRKVIDITGKRFGKLTVIARFTSGKKEIHPQWVCRCDCGTITVISGNNLKSGNSKTCGCSKSKMGRPVKHGRGKTRLYRIFQNMKQRCFNEKCPDFIRYGKRGITVCDEWKNDFIAFEKWAMSNGYADNLTLDRINTNDDYYPQNCRWITKGEQARNRRNNIVYQGRCIAEWARITGIHRSRIIDRIKHGWSIEKAVTTPTLLHKR